MKGLMNANSCIQCSVSSCSYHNSLENVCSLSSIQVGSCGPVSKDCACTECASYRMTKMHETD